MSIYQEKLYPILKKTAEMIEATPHMQSIVNGTMSDERFKFQIQQNYQYLLEYTKCWSLALSKCTCFEEMEIFYPIVKSTFESTVGINRTYWAEQTGMTVDELDSVIMANGKRSYTSFQLAASAQGTTVDAIMSMFPCNIIYRYFGEDLLPLCKLDPENKFYKWIEFYATDAYIAKTENEIAIIEKLLAGKSEREVARLLEIMCVSCNYEILQWQDLYYNMSTWPLDEIFPPKFTTVKE